jgi:hypothetical protein
MAANHSIKGETLCLSFPNWVYKRGFIAFAFSLAFVGIGLIIVFGYLKFGCIKLQIIN